MVYATIRYQGDEKICCMDQAGGRVFLLDDFFMETQYPGSSSPGNSGSIPADMNEFISVYCDAWNEDIACFFGERPELAIPVEDVTFLAPIPAPKRNLVCLGKNYEAHAKELKGQIFSDQPPAYPIYFTKPDHTVIGTGETILLHEAVTKRLDYEIELAVVIGKKGINIPKEKAEDYIFGYTIANDVSARDLQKSHTQWYKGKSLTTHCPMGPHIVHKSVLPLPLSLAIRCYVNGELRQDGNTSDLLFDIPTIISDLSRGYELRPGDIILTGTPAGVGMAMNPPRYLKAGDEILCEIEKIGVLINPVDHNG